MSDIYTKGKIEDYGIAKNGKGDPQIFVTFEVEMNDKIAVPFEEGSETKRITWYGHLSSEKAREITIKALLCLGFKGSDASELQAGLDSKALDTARLVDLTVGDETYEGKTRTKIKFINPPGGGMGKVERMEAAESKKALSGLNLKAAIAGVKKENPHLVKVANGEGAESIF